MTNEQKTDYKTISKIFLFQRKNQEKNSIKTKAKEKIIYEMKMFISICANLCFHGEPKKRNAEGRKAGEWQVY